VSPCSQRDDQTDQSQVHGGAPMNRPHSCSTFSLSPTSKPARHHLATTSTQGKLDVTQTWISQPFSPHFPKLLFLLFCRSCTQSTSLSTGYCHPSSGISVSPLPFFLALPYTCRLRLSIRRRRPAGSRSRTLFPLSSLPSDASTLSPFFLIASEPGQGAHKCRSCTQTYIFRCSG
jgi:hypothetical protein